MPPRPAQPRVRVWDRPVRLMHWALAASVATAWLTRSDLGVLHDVHEIAGYAATALVAARTAWGWAGSRHARFASFVRAPAATWRYARDVLAACLTRGIGLEAMTNAAAARTYNVLASEGRRVALAMVLPG